MIAQQITHQKQPKTRNWGNIGAGDQNSRQKSALLREQNTEPNLERPEIRVSR